METAVYILLGLTSMFGTAMILWRGWALRWSQAIPPRVVSALTECRSREDVKNLVSVCQKYPSPLSRLIRIAAERLDWSKEENQESLEIAARHEIVQMERGLVALEVIVGIAPLLGLVGTIAGMMTVFADLGQTGLNDAAKLAQGIALILRATLAGLLIAIPSLIFWSYFTKKVEVLAVEMETLCDEFLRKQYRDHK